MFERNGYQPLDPAAVRPRRKQLILTAVAGTVGLIALGSLIHTGPQITSLLRTPDTCNPYALPGMLVYDGANPHANRWHPFAGMRDGPEHDDATDPQAAVDKCTQPAPALAAAFVRASWASVPRSTSDDMPLEPEFVHAPTGPDGRPWEDVEFARNRTVVVLGDSISRFTTKYFCEMVGEKAIELNWGHPWAPAEIFKNGSTADEPDRSGDAELDPFGWHRFPPGNPGAHLAHYCYAPGMDFLLVHLHSYGLDEEEFWKSKPSYIPPYKFEDRMTHLVREYLNRIRATTGRGASAPELVYLNSGMWDVMRFAHEDIAANKNLASTLGAPRLSWYRRRVREALTFVSKEFPQASVYWSSTHYPIKPSNGWFFGDIKPKHRPEIKLLRLAEMHGAAVSAFEDTGDATPEDRAALDRVGLGHWGLAMAGQEDHQVDDLHPTFLPGGYLWADMALWDLRYEVTRRRL